jgi:hypothetical protein
MATNEEVRFHFEVSVPADTREVDVDVRDSRGNRLSHDPGKPLQFTTNRDARVSLAAGWRQPPTNRLLTSTIPMQRFIATGSDADRVSINTADSGIVCAGVGLRTDELGIRVAGTKTAVIRPRSKAIAGKAGNEVTETDDETARKPKRRRKLKR